MSRIKVLVTLGSLGVGGNEVFAMNLFRHLDKSKFQMDFAVFDHKRLDFYPEIISNSGRVFFCDSSKNNKILKLIDETRNINRLLKKNKYDIIHCNSCSFFGMIPGIAAGKRNKVHIISHSHNAGSQSATKMDLIFRYALKRYICSSVDYGFTCSDVAGKSKYTQNFMKSSRYIQINNAIETSHFLFDNTIREEVRRAWNILDDEIVIGHVGRFEKQKNHIFLLDVFKKISEANPKTKLLLIGDGSLLEKSKQYVKENHISDQVIFAGQRDDVEKLYNAMDCFLLPSLYEGFPFVLVESQINGLSGIVSDTITKSANISGRLLYASINSSPKTWADMVLSMDYTRNTGEKLNEIINRYDLDYETKRIERLYSQLITLD